MKGESAEAVFDKLSAELDADDALLVIKSGVESKWRTSVICRSQFLRCEVVDVLLVRLDHLLRCKPAVLRREDGSRRPHAQVREDAAVRGEQRPGVEVGRWERPRMCSARAPRLTLGTPPATRQASDARRRDLPSLDRFCIDFGLILARPLRSPRIRQN